MMNLVLDGIRVVEVAEWLFVPSTGALLADWGFTEWKALLSTMDAPWAPHQRIAELIDDPQVTANGYIGEVTLEDERRYKLPRVPVQLGGQPPELHRAPEHGEHTEEILLELGLEWGDIAALKEAEVVL